MKKSTLIATLAVLAIVLSITLVYAQGRGAGFARAGQPCPYGNTQPNPAAGGWWTRAQATKPEQSTFAAEAAALHNQIRDRQMQMAQLRSSNGDAKKVQTLEQDVQRLRGQLHQYMLDNQQTRQQMGPGGRMGGAGNGRLGLPCPNGYTQPNPDAGGWWTRTRPNTPEQSAFVETVTGLHNRIRERQMALAPLRTANGDPKQIEALDRELLALRAQLQDYMANNQQVRQQLGAPNCSGTGPGGCGMAGQCQMRNGMTGPGIGGMRRGGPGGK